MAISTLNSVAVLISKDLIGLVIIHDEFGLKNNVLKKYVDMNEKIIKLKT